MKKIIEISHLNKTFGDVEAIKDLSFCVKEGELFAFLGVNGAGKSTTINIMCGRLNKNSGTVIIDDHNIDININDVKKELGVVFQNCLLDQALSVKDNLENRAALYNINGKEFSKRLNELSNLLDFGDFVNRPINKLSGGQRRKIDIARALLHKPKILILDEPTTGLDPQTRKTLWNVIATLRKEENMTVFLTTHYMEEASEANYVVILDDGQIVAEGTPIDLKNKYTGDFIMLYGITEADVAILGMPYEKILGGYCVAVANTKAATELIVKHSEIFNDYEITKGKMDDVFLAVTGKKLMGGAEK
ncbi:MAG: ABC transporter ATP-binding protein [Bacilli bacterium]